jgi:predicted nucleotide-binding protein (sugar kinase/HSP70/actin superfamily)
VDYLFMPRLVSVEEKAYICPKFLGLPDMVRNSVKGLPRLISPDINLYKGNNQIHKSVWEVGKVLSNKPWRVYQAYKVAYQAYKDYQKLLLSGYLPQDALAYLQKAKLTKNPLNNQVSSSVDDIAAASGLQPLTVALISHPYNIYDEHLNMGLLSRLKKMGVRVVTPENVDSAIVQRQAARLPKKLFWSMGRKLIGAAYYFIESPQVDGIIHLAAFGCGPDSFTGELIEREIRRLTDELESLKGYITNLDRQVTYSEIQIRFEKNQSAIDVGN